MTDVYPRGQRCRSLRPIVHPGGVLRRAAVGTVLTSRENIGRRLVTVDFDGGERLVLFEHEIEPLEKSGTIDSERSTSTARSRAYDERA